MRISASLVGVRLLLLLTFVTGGGYLVSKNSWAAWLCLLLGLGAVGIILWGVFTPSAQLFIAAATRGATNSKALALTFDDGPSKTFTPIVLEVLRTAEVKAFFFCIGRYAEQHPALMHQIIAEGHGVGNHSYSHDTWLPFASRKKILADYRRANIALSKLIGVPVAWFRPPFGVTNPSVGYATTTLGLKIAGWSIRSYDTAAKNPGKVVAYVLRQLHPGAIVLLHDRLTLSAEVLQGIIEGAKAKGYSFVRMDTLLSDAGHEK